MEVAPRPKNVSSRNNFGEILGTKLFFGRKYGDEKKLVKKASCQNQVYGYFGQPILHRNNNIYWPNRRQILY